MKELHGSASAVVPTPVEQCFALLEALDGYPSWYPEVVKEAEVLAREGDGSPSRARATLHVAAGPLVRDFHLVLAVQVDRPSLVALKRISHDASDQEEFQVTWRLEERSGTRITLELEANLSVSRFLPVGGIGESLAQGFVDAAARALR